MANDKNKNMKLEKSAQELKNDKSIPTIKGKQDEPEIDFDKVREELVPGPDMIVFRVPEKTESGIILPDGQAPIDEDEYRPRAEICGSEVEFITPGDEMILHSQAQQAAVPLKYEGYGLYMVHQQFVVGKRPGKIED